MKDTKDNTLIICLAIYAGSVALVAIPGIIVSIVSSHLIGAFILLILGSIPVIQFLYVLTDTYIDKNLETVNIDKNHEKQKIKKQKDNQFCRQQSEQSLDKLQKLVRQVSVWNLGSRK